VTFPYRLLEDSAKLASFMGWSEEVYRDFFRLRSGELSEARFIEKYQRRRAILSIDMTGFTTAAIRLGELPSLLRILDAQRVAIPVLEDSGAELIRCFADDIVALFDNPNIALDAAFEIHRRVQQFNQSSLASRHPTHCCAGIGFGPIFAIGPNLAQGDEMNQASKLGEDIARGNETLVTERAYAALVGRSDVIFEPQEFDDQLFRFYRATSRSRDDGRSD